MGTSMDHGANLFAIPLEADIVALDGFLRVSSAVRWLSDGYPFLSAFSAMTIHDKPTFGIRNEEKKKQNNPRSQAIGAVWV